jgi:predicted nucleic acid-binding protein
MTLAGSAVPLVVDTSAWARHRRPAVVDLWTDLNAENRLASCPVAALEIYRTARNEEEFDALSANFDLLPQAPVTASVCRSALAASRDLGARRRIPVPDYLIAAAAAERGFGVLHADRHFDLLAEVLPFESVRLPE